MFETMKIIHMLGLMGGGAAMIGNGLLMKRVMSAGAPPPDMVASTMRVLGFVGLASIVLLWLTGIVMTLQLGVAFDASYLIKLIGAAVVLGAVSTMSIHSANAAKAGGPPNFQLMKRMASFARIGVLVAIIFAVLVFN